MNIEGSKSAICLSTVCSYAEHRTQLPCCVSGLSAKFCQYHANLVRRPSREHVVTSIKRTKVKENWLVLFIFCEVLAVAPVWN